MKSFSKVFEESKAEKIYKVTANIEIEVKAENEGEAGYLADSILGSVEENISFSIENIEEIQESGFDMESFSNPEEENNLGTDGV